MALASSNAVRQLSDGNSLGTVLGISSTDVIGFYGTPNTSPQIQLSIVGSTLAGSQVTTFPTGATGGGAVGSTWGFATSTQAAMVVSTMTALWKMGIIG